MQAAMEQDPAGGAPSSLIAALHTCRDAITFWPLGCQTLLFLAYVMAC